MVLTMYLIVVSIISCFLGILGYNLFRPKFRKQLMHGYTKDYYITIVVGYICIIMIWIGSIVSNLLTYFY